MTAPADFKDHFSPLAAGYARFRPTYPRELFEYLAGLVGRHELAWDCATGNGQAARGLVSFFNRVVATDASNQQIVHAERHARVAYLVAPAEDAPIESSAADLITVGAAVHWFDFEKFYAEVYRVLRPEGALAVWCYDRVTVSPEVDAVGRIFSGEIVGPYWPPERRYVEEGYRTIPFPFEEITVPDFTLSDERSMEGLIGYWHTWSATRRYIEKNHADPVEAVRQMLEQAWGDPSAAKLLRWPLSLRVGRARTG